VAHIRRPSLPNPHSNEAEPPSVSLSRRGFLTGAGAIGAAAAASPLALIADDAKSAPADGTPEQVHITWGDDPSSTVFVSWASPTQVINPRVNVRHSSGGANTIHAVQRTYTDGLNGQTVFTYHAKLGRLPHGSIFHCSVTADNDRNREQPFTATFQTAPRGRVPFRWTSYGDLATPVTSWVLCSPQSR
jgi:phosphodiesterase/alkaline phosphatase D-like protein